MIIKDTYTMYKKSYDITFIVVDEWEDDKLISTECVGWYYGPPSEANNVKFTGKLKATYEGGL